MDCNNLPSYLSKQVRHMLVEIGEPYSKKYCNSYVYTNPRLTFKWEEIESILCISGNFVIHDQQSTWFCDKIGKLWPIFAEAHSLLIQSSPSLVDIQDLCKWTSQPEEIVAYLHHFQSSDLSITEAVLFLTAVLERSLGNLFLLNGRNVPSQLRDLLSTSEVLLVLGQVPVVFLQILLGTPLALNLRNIAWHGFPREDELYPHFVSTLFVVIFSIGERLLGNEIDFLSIPKRSQVNLQSIFDDTFPSIKYNHEEILQLLSDSDYIPSSHFSHWNKALEHYHYRRYGRSLLLLLPQVEHMLRCLYCSINKCSERALTAESVTFYTTLNEIMAENIINEDDVIKENKLFKFLGESVFEILQDLFLHQAGPRIRDKMSHGEFNIQCIPECLVNQLIFLSLVIEVKLDELMHNKTSEENIKPASELKNYILFTHGCYVSKFHPSSLVKMSIRQSLSRFSQWYLCISPQFNNETELRNTVKERSELSFLIEQINSCLQKHAPFAVQCDASILAYIASLKCHTVFRHKSENEILNLLKQIAANVEEICEQVAENSEVKSDLSSLHLLRSRQRLTFQRMLYVLPQLRDVLFCITCIVVLLLQSVNNICNLSTKEFENLTKFLRTILQFVQNVVTMTNRNKNRWLEIRTSCEKFCCKILDKLNDCNFL